MHNNKRYHATQAQICMTRCWKRSLSPFKIDRQIIETIQAR
ncbi:MAG: hypothetical protein ACI8UP_003038 [Porticoccaceae bacterium]|jgi:hypothetical protein